MSDKKELNFEEAMEKLEKISTELEDGKLTLDESVEKFEEGMKLSKACNDILEKAEKKITMLVKDGENIKEVDFVPNED
ncbi:MAG: exodeoxyribonuclease VII small subunit [Christensenellales bacterium]